MLIKEGHIRIITAKFGQNPASRYCLKQLLTMHNTQRTSNNHNSSPEPKVTPTLDKHEKLTNKQRVSKLKSYNIFQRLPLEGMYE